MIFPPIFSLTIFFILDTIALVFDIFVITSVVGVVINTLATGLYIARTYLTYGSKKTAEKLFKFKGADRKSIIKKSMKIFGGSIIPYVNCWAVWSDYKDDLKELKNKNGEVNEEEVEDKGKEKPSIGLKEKLAIGATVLATGGAAAPLLAGELGAAEAATGAAAEGLASKEALSVGEKKIGSWITSKTKNNIIPNVSKKTIQEDVSGMKTGISNPEDYQSNIPDWSDIKTYEKTVSEKLEKKLLEDRQREEKRKREQKEISEKEIREEEQKIDVFKRRFGDESDVVNRLKNRALDLKNDNKDKYREEL